MRIGLFFGSFNPIHNGHLMLAQYMANFGGVDEVWFVVSPHNPFKQMSDLAPADDRVEMVRLAVSDSPYFKVCDVELHLPVPSYTFNTLQELKQQYPDYEFVLIMGGDNVRGLPRWFKSEEILKHRILVYPRPGEQMITIEGSNIEYTNAPMVDISSTMLRQWISRGCSISYYVPLSVARYISCRHLYS